MNKAKLLTLALLGGTLLFGASMPQAQAAPHKAKVVTKKVVAKKPAAKQLYTCEMHPDYVTDKPGHCPKCGMTLIKKNGK